MAITSIVLVLFARFLVSASAQVCIAVIAYQIYKLAAQIMSVDKHATSARTITNVALRNVVPLMATVG